MEHCFNPAQVMLNAATLTEVGGTVIHHVPTNNWVDHGFYQFSPTLFFDFYSANNFSNIKMKIHFMGRVRESYIDYDPQADDPLPYAFGGLTRVMVFFSAKKTAESTVFKFPIQGRYRQFFGDKCASASKLKIGIMQRLRVSFRKRTIRLRSISL